MIADKGDIRREVISNLWDCLDEKSYKGGELSSEMKTGTAEAVPVGDGEMHGYG
jgi:hypothetical protein